MNTQAEYQQYSLMTDTERTTLEGIFSECLVALAATRERPDPHRRAKDEEFVFADNFLHLHKVIHELAFIPTDLAYDTPVYSDVMDVLCACLEWLLDLKTVFETDENEVLH